MPATSERAPDGATPNQRLLRWTRRGALEFPWNPFETLERLALAPDVREKLESLARGFGAGRESYHAFKLPWRRGIFLFGASGTGKSAAGRALARALGWTHLTVPAHEILDSHLFERALAEIAADRSSRVIVLEDIDLIIKRMETDVFFTLLDHALERTEGCFWVATSRHPETTPKTQLLRPGRFDESLRLDSPATAVRRELLMSMIVPFFTAASAPESETLDEKTLDELVTRTEGLTYAHFEELRQVCARLKVDGRESEIWSAMNEYLTDQVLFADRWGGLSDATEALEQRLRQIDPRVMTAALELTDVFRSLIEKAVSDAATQSSSSETEISQ